jgi:hypothetical protein
MKVSLESEAFRCNTGIFDFQPILKEHCRTRRVELSVFAFRTGRTNFDVPGATEWQGCQIVALADDVSQAARDVFRQAPKSLAGFPVISAAEEYKLSGPANVPKPSGFGAPAKAGQQPKRVFLFAMPSPRVLVTATSEPVLRDVLEGFANPEAGKGVPIGSSLPDTQAALWALRRLGPAFSPVGPAAVIQDDPQARMILIAYDRVNNDLNLRYISANPQSEQTFARLIERLMARRVTVRRVDREIVEGTLRQVDGRIWMGVMAMLGIVVFL